MKKTKSKHSTKKIPKLTLSALTGICLFIVVGIMPLIIRAIFREPPPEAIPMSGPEYLNIFSYYRSYFILLPALAILVYTIISLVTSPVKLPSVKSLIKNPIFILPATVIFFTVLSAALSDYGTTAIWGMMDRNEGLIMWLAYFVVFGAAFILTKNLKNAKYVYCGLVFSSLIMGIIGISQLTGNDLLATDFVGSLITLGEPRLSGVSPYFDIAYGTLYNPNTLGKYAAMVAPVLLLAGFVFKGNKIINILLFASGFLMLVNIFASGSLGGLVGAITAAGILAVTLICGIIYRRRYNVKIPASKEARRFFAAAGLVLVLGAGSLVLFNNTVNAHVRVLFLELERAIIGAELSSPVNYRFSGSTMEIHDNNGLVATFSIVDFWGANWISFTDSMGNEIPYTLTSGVNALGAETLIYVFDVPGYNRVVIERAHMLNFSYRTGAFFPLELVYYEGGLFGLMPPQEIIDFNDPIPSFGFTGLERWGSSRGYIWSRTFPLLPRYAIIGAGPDAFYSAFPGHDLLGKLMFMSNPYIRVDKAHNFFLNTWVNTGGISAFALYGLFVFYLVTTFISLVKNKGEDLLTFGLRLGLLSGIGAFVMSSMATDSTIGSGGVFFVLLGLGFGLNYFTKNSQASQ